MGWLALIKRSHVIFSFVCFQPPDAAVTAARRPVSAPAQAAGARAPAAVPTAPPATAAAPARLPPATARQPAARARAGAPVLHATKVQDAQFHIVNISFVSFCILNCS